MSIVGTVLDERYFIRGQLGAGNFGAVYLAEQRVFGLPLRQVALKLFRRQMVTAANAAEVLKDAVILMRLQQEPTHAKVAQSLVSVLDTGFLREDPDQAFVAMEYVQGFPTPGGGRIPTLQGLIQAYHPVPVALGLRWMVDVLRPLAWMHTLDTPVLHCDIKPDNVLADGADRLKLADFGLAQLTFGAIGTAHGAGAITCQAPETLAMLTPTTAADVYSIGLLFHEIFAGANPLRDAGIEAAAAGDHEGQVRCQIEARLEGIPALDEYGHPELHDHPVLCDIVDNCLRFKPTDRYDNAAVVLRDVQAYLNSDGTLDRFLAEALSFYRRGRVGAALGRAQEALTRYPESAAPWVTLARIYQGLSKSDKTIDVCLRGLRVFAEEPELLCCAADAYDAVGETELARQLRARCVAEKRRRKS